MSDDIKQQLQDAVTALLATEATASALSDQVAAVTQQLLAATAQRDEATRVLSELMRPLAVPDPVQFVASGYSFSMRAMDESCDYEPLPPALDALPLSAPQVPA